MPRSRKRGALRQLNGGAGTKQTMGRDERAMKMGTPAVALALFAAASALAQAPVPVTACAGVPVVVIGAPVDETETACDGARAAFTFFAPLNLGAAPALTIELVEGLPAGMPGDAVGAYVVPSQRVLVLRYEPFSWHRSWFGLAADKRLYRAVIAHEVAHAIADRHAGESRLSLAAQEYVAYVAMIATMPEDHRRELLALHPGSGFEDVSEINELVYAFNPGHFAAKAYRHWTQQPDPPVFLQQVLEGGVIQGLAEY